MSAAKPACLLILFATSPAWGVIHAPPATLKEMCDGVGWIRVLKAVPAKGGVLLEPVETIRKGRETGVESFRLAIPATASGAEAIRKKLGAGAPVVLFSNENKGKGLVGFGYACVDEAWFSVDYNAEGKFWLFLRAEPGLSETYHGPAKDLPALVKDALAGKKPKVPTRAAKEPDHRLRALRVDEAMRRNRYDYPTKPLPTAWGKPAEGVQAGLRLNPANGLLEVVVRNVGREAVVFTHLQLAFSGKEADGTLALKSKAVAPEDQRLVVLVSPGDAYVLARIKPASLGLRPGENRVGAEAFALKLDDKREAALATGWLDVAGPAPKKP
ncbi:MAG: hypothetical protein K2W96_08080 [Gemmataceae bacterium]|nr:hypothetical protein [Gemmataceae bacterium]